MLSLRQRLWILWGLALAACLVVALLLTQLYRASAAAQLGRADALVQQACEAIRDRYGFYVAGWDGTGADHGFGGSLVPVVSIALVGRSGIEGGIWSQATGGLAFAFPTAVTPGAASGFPEAQRERIAAATARAIDGEQTVLRRFRSGSQLVLLAACPLGGPVPVLAAWTMTRVRPAGTDTLRLSLGVLLLLLLGIAGWVARLTTRWGRHVQAIETALGGQAAGGAGHRLPHLAETGEPELDRVVLALNRAAGQLAEAQSRAASAERLAALGRVAAGVAHEIRNPLGAIRLRAENALAGDGSRQQAALQASLVQVARIERLVEELLAMTQRRTPERVAVALAPFLERLAAQHRRPDAASIAIACGGGTARFDPDLIGRALDNLLQNALRHTPPDGVVTLAAELSPDLVRITVRDTGEGVSDRIKGRLFEPFATGRPDGTGLGLAIAREMAAAHGGSLMLTDAGLAPGGGGGAAFALDLPQGAARPEEAACP